MGSREIKIYELPLTMFKSNSAELANLTLTSPSSRGPGVALIVSYNKVKDQLRLEKVMNFKSA